MRRDNREPDRQRIQRIVYLRRGRGCCHATVFVRTVREVDQPSIESVWNV
jgi:hypothetical protein